MRTGTLWDLAGVSSVSSPSLTLKAVSARVPARKMAKKIKRKNLSADEYFVDIASVF